MVGLNMNGARMKSAWLVLLATTAGLIYLYPEQAGVLLSKLNRVALGAVLGVVLDRSVFWYARPSVEARETGWMYRRAVIIVGVALAAAVAV